MGTNATTTSTSTTTTQATQGKGSQATQATQAPAKPASQAKATAAKPAPAKAQGKATQGKGKGSQAAPMAVVPAQAIATGTRQPVVCTTSQPVTGPNLLAAVAAGTVRFAKVRGTGTYRAWPVLAQGSQAHKRATTYATAYAGGKGQPVAAIAKQHGTSVPTVRRALTALAFTQALHSAKPATLAALAKAATAHAAQGGQHAAK